MKTKVIAVVGRKGAGKTTTIEILTRKMTGRGYRVTAVKHIPEPDFTIDEEGKDTWRFAQSGAEAVVAVASTEIVTIEKTVPTKSSFEDILQRSRGADLVLLEGFKELVGNNSDVPKIVAVKSSDETLEALKMFKPILAFTGLVSKESLDVNIPYVNVLIDAEKIVDMVEKYVKKE